MRKIKILALFLACSLLAFAQQGSDNLTQSKPYRHLTIRVSSDLLNGKLDHVELPKYPEAALQNRIHGDVILGVIVDESGKVILASPVEGDPLLTAASVEALREFHFRPTVLNGRAIQVDSVVGFQFSIHGHGANRTGKVKYQAPAPYHKISAGNMADKNVLVLWPRKLSGEEPQLPPDLAGKSGSVYLNITIGEDGKVQDVKVLGGDSALVDPVVAAVKKFIYEPQMVHGKPSKMTTEASYHFGSAT